jgi:hypothetical protein
MISTTPKTQKYNSSTYVDPKPTLPKDSHLNPVTPKVNQPAPPPQHNTIPTFNDISSMFSNKNPPPTPSVQNQAQKSSNQAPSNSYSSFLSNPMVQQSAASAASNSHVRQAAVKSASNPTVQKTALELAGVSDPRMQKAAMSTASNPIVQKTAIAVGSDPLVQKMAWNAATNPNVQNSVYSAATKNTYNSGRKGVSTVTALCDYNSSEPEDLNFKRGDTIFILEEGTETLLSFVLIVQSLFIYS